MAEQQQQIGAASSLSAVNVSELGKALDQATISTASVDGSPSARASMDDDGDEPDEGDEEDDYDEDQDDDDDEEDDEEEDDEEDEYGEEGYGEDGDEYGMLGVSMSFDDEDGALGIKLESIPSAAPPKSKSPKKRGRTDSLKKMLPAPASQRHKQKDDGGGVYGDFNGGDDDGSGSQKTPPAKLLVKDRTGAGMGVPRPHLISNAVKQAPPAKEKSNPRRWSKAEDESLRLAVERSGERNWKAIADQVPGRNHTQCLQRWTKVLKPGLIKGHWTPEEDNKLRELVTEEKKNWGQVASLIPGRTSKQCRERWCNHLDPNINKGSYTEDEDKIIIEMQSKLGNRWSIIAQQLKGRTEDAVKIRWKSLMRGRRAAMKDEKSHNASSASSVSIPTETVAPEKPKAKATKATLSRQKTRAASPVIKAEKISAATKAVQVEKAQVASTAMSSAVIPDLQPADLSFDSGDVVEKIDALELAAAMNIQTANDDLVAASIHSFQMSQRFQNGGSASAVPANLYANPGASQTISPANHAMYSVPNGYNHNVNAIAQQQQQQQQHQYPVQLGYNSMQQNPNMQQNYGMPSSYGAPPQMGMPVQQGNSIPQPMQYYLGMPNGMNNIPPQGYSQQQGFGGPPRQMYQAAGAGMGFSGSMYSQPGMPMSTQNFNAMQAGIYGGSFGGNPMAASGSMQAGSNMNVGLPPSSASAAAKMLNTPREEWGSSQTPRSQMILTEGHASAYELFHQQRVRLMLQEREKHGLTLSSAPSPGQAMLTKELEANKERQKRQAIMQKGWKSAVEAMMLSNSDLSALDDQQRFDGFLEKVTLSALDPTDDELINDIIADESLDVETPLGYKENAM